MAIVKIDTTTFPPTMTMDGAPLRDVVKFRMECDVDAVARAGIEVNLEVGSVFEVDVKTLFLGVRPLAFDGTVEYVKVPDGPAQISVKPAVGPGYEHALESIRVVVDAIDRLGLQDRFNMHELSALQAAREASKR